MVYVQVSRGIPGDSTKLPRMTDSKERKRLVRGLISADLRFGGRPFHPRALGRALPIVIVIILIDATLLLALVGDVFAAETLRAVK